MPRDGFLAGGLADVGSQLAGGLLQGRLAAEDLQARREERQRRLQESQMLQRFKEADLQFRQQQERRLEEEARQPQQHISQGQLVTIPRGGGAPTFTPIPETPEKKREREATLGQRERDLFAKQKQREVGRLIAAELEKQGRHLEALSVLANLESPTLDPTKLLPKQPPPPRQPPAFHVTDDKGNVTLVEPTRDPSGKVTVTKTPLGSIGKPSAGGRPGDSPFTDEDMEFAAQMWVKTGKQPSFGMGASARPDRARFWHQAKKAAEEVGGPAGVVAVQAAIANLRTAGGQLQKTYQLAEGFSRTAEKNMDDTLALSEKVDRTGVPMINKYLLAGRKAWTNDPDVVEFAAAVQTDIFEISRVLSSANATGVVSDSARQEIEGLLNTAMTKEQFVAVAARLRREMHNRRDAYRAQLKEIDSDLRSAGRSEKPPPAGPPAPAPAPPSAPAPLMGAPPAGQHTGRTMTDRATGKRYRSDGVSWVPVP